MGAYDLFGGGGKQGGGNWSTQSILSLLLKLQGGEQGAQAQTAPQAGGGGAMPTTPPPSAAPIGQSAPTGGQPSTRPQGSPLARALGKGGKPPMKTTPSGGGTPMGMGGGKVPPTPNTIPPSGPTMGGGKITGGGDSTGLGDLGTMAETAGVPYGEVIGQVGETAMQLYDAFSMDEQEKLSRADRHLKEQQFEHRANWEQVYKEYFLPAMAGSQGWAYSKLGQESDQYAYASELLEGYLEGSKGVWGGTSDWDSVWQAIDGEIESGRGESTFFSQLQDNYKTVEVRPMQQAIIGNILGQMFPDLPTEYYMPWATELAKWGNAMMETVGKGNY